MNYRYLALVAIIFVLAACDPGQRYSVEFDAWAIGSVPTDRITVDTSQMGDAARKKETKETRNSGGGKTIHEIYNVDRPVKIIVVPIESDAP